jgi:hypothetical protein
MSSPSRLRSGPSEGTVVIDNRGGRFGLEVLFLAALAAVLAIATVRPLIIIGVMAAGWVLVALVEWAVWRGQPHYGSGLPPRYYVPRLNLPPAQVLEQVRAGYPEAQRDEAPTWIASAALRAEVLGEWPSAPEAPPEPEQLPVIEAQPVDPEPEPEPEPAPQPEPVRLPPVRLEVASGTPRARYSFDPLSEPAPKRRFGRRHEPEAPELEVPARPSLRALPGTAQRQ